MTEIRLPLGTRLWFAFVCFFRILWDPYFAQRAYWVRDALPTPPIPEASRDTILESPKALEDAARNQGALQVLTAFQREGRLIDFLQEDPTGVKDADLGAATRQIHQGCRKVLLALVQMDSVRHEEEGQVVQVPSDYDASSLRLTGNIKGSGPYRGTLTHRGWRVCAVTLPTLLPGADVNILAPAEVEL